MNHRIELSSSDYRKKLTLIRDPGYAPSRIPQIRIDCGNELIWLDMKTVQRMIDWLQIQVKVEDV